MKRPQVDAPRLKGLDFYRARGFDEPNELVASVRIEGGKLVWTAGAGSGRRILSSVHTAADPDADPAAYLQEVRLYVRSPYLWAVKVE